MNAQVIRWTKQKRDNLADKLEYLNSIHAHDDDVFNFEGHAFVIGYAKYLLQYLDNQDQE